MCPTEATVSLLLSPSTAEDEARWLKQAFRILDADGDGSIGGSDLNAFSCGCLRRDLSNEVIISMIAEVDNNGDGAVDFHSFHGLLSVSSPSVVSSTFLRAQRQRTERAVLRHIFDVLDVNQDGLLSHADLGAVMAKVCYPISEQELQEMFDVAPEARTSAAIDFETYLRIMDSLEL
ncbi:hypothetical protein KP509_24G033300 [Ceratopteris richardii]|uniref:EF-hand domain-containing protein n=1 Tax=Ceratopteris richardii TaxID=49495 RepID=A0A8T2RWQ1_CERRI|nr:hypothetical protein KP509_24G033300 [Ceratopteris richardii]